MVDSTTFNLVNFLNLMGYIFNPQTCSPLGKAGVYPKCHNHKLETFDFIIVGAGPAGCVLANRLSRNPDVNVLLIEAGEYPSVISEMPADSTFLPGSEYDYNFTLVQSDFFHANKDGLGTMTQGRALGGGSAINGMVEAPGVPYDYNNWANLVKDQDWAYDKLEPYFAKVSAMVRSTKPIIPSLTWLNIVLGAKQLGYTVNDSDDLYGYHNVPVMVYQERRNSIARAYLNQLVRRRNLCVVVNKPVTKIYINPITKTAEAIETYGKYGPIYISATREIIISAGAINSPKLLMLSGIGPRMHLNNLGINVIQALPVGHLRDPVVVPIYVTTPSQVGLPSFKEYIKLYCALGYSLTTNRLANFIGMFRTRENITQPNVEVVHAEFPALDKVFLPHFVRTSGYSDTIEEQFYQANKYMGILLFEVINLHPKSHGRVLLKSPDPSSTPLIHPNYLTNKYDSEVLIDGILDVVIPLLDTLPLTFTNLLKFDLPECDALPIKGDPFRSREYWECYLSYFARSALHPTATCRMGSAISNSTVDTHFRVWGIQKLRVVDTSAIPITISGHPTIPVTMMSEKAADIILKDNRLN